MVTPKQLREGWKTPLPSKEARRLDIERDHTTANAAESVAGEDARNIELEIAFHESLGSKMGMNLERKRLQLLMEEKLAEAEQILARMEHELRDALRTAALEKHPETTSLSIEQVVQFFGKELKEGDIGTEYPLPCRYVVLAQTGKGFAIFYQLDNSSSKTGSVGIVDSLPAPLTP